MRRRTLRHNPPRYRHTPAAPQGATCGQYVLWSLAGVGIVVAAIVLMALANHH